MTTKLEQIDSDHLSGLVNEATSYAEDLLKQQPDGSRDLMDLIAHLAGAQNALAKMGAQHPDEGGN